MWRAAPPGANLPPSHPVTARPPRPCPRPASIKQVTGICKGRGGGPTHGKGNTMTKSWLNIFLPYTIITHRPHVKEAQAEMAHISG